MSFFDWDGNGKKDFMDEFIEFNVFMEYMKNDDKNENTFDSDDDLFDNLDEE
ncbi:MAG: hypothetical protein IJE46_05970 [Clostridia bacterium]|nr:hypothetical protein [Clostridia bacterium]